MAHRSEKVGGFRAGVGIGAQVDRIDRHEQEATVPRSERRGDERQAPVEAELFPERFAERRGRRQIGARRAQFSPRERGKRATVRTAHAQTAFVERRGNAEGRGRLERGRDLARHPPLEIVGAKLSEKAVHELSDSSELVPLLKQNRR